MTSFSHKDTSAPNGVGSFNINYPRWDPVSQGVGRYLAGGRPRDELQLRVLDVTIAAGVLIPGTGHGVSVIVSRQLVQTNDNTPIGDPEVLSPAAIAGGPVVVPDLEDGAVLGKITATGKYTELAPNASDGSQVAAGVMWGPLAAQTIDQMGKALVGGGVRVFGDRLVWPHGISDGQRATAAAQLGSLGIQVLNAAS